jgi:hypothetical protein
MIRCARLRPYNHRNGDIMRSLTMPSGLQLTAGFDLTPSPVRVVTDAADWRILGTQPQVDCFEVADVAALHARLGAELTTRMLAGGNAALAPVVDALPPPVAAGPLPVIGLELAPVAEPIVAPAPTPVPVVMAPQFTPAPMPAPVAKPPAKPAKRRR